MWPALARVGMLGKNAWPWILKGYNGLSHVGNAAFLATMAMNPSAFFGFGGGEGEPPAQDGELHTMDQRQQLLNELARLQQGRKW